MLSDDPRLEQAGFAKLSGPNISFIVRKYEVVMGRKSKSTPLDLVLGDNMNISRQHARIYYNFQLQRWEIEALGKNGFDVNGRLVLPEHGPAILYSQDKVTIADRMFYFLLPKAPMQPGLTAGAQAQRPSSSKPPAGSARSKRRKTALDPQMLPTVPPMHSHSPALARPAAPAAAPGQWSAPVSHHHSHTGFRYPAASEALHYGEDEPIEGEEEPEERMHALPQRPAPLPHHSSYDAQPQMDYDEDEGEVGAGRPLYNGHHAAAYDDQSEPGDEDEDDYEYDANGGYS